MIVSLTDTIVMDKDEASSGEMNRTLSTSHHVVSVRQKGRSHILEEAWIKTRNTMHIV